MMRANLQTNFPDTFLVRGGNPQGGGGRSPESSSNPEENARERRPKILIVDDNVAVRRGLRTFVGRAGPWEICGEAATGAEAVSKARELRPDVILLDISLPDFSGLEAAVRIRRELAVTKIIVVTQHEHVLPQVKAAGADGYVSKANLASELIPAIRSAVETN